MVASTNWLHGRYGRYYGAQLRVQWQHSGMLLLDSRSIPSKGHPELPSPCSTQGGFSVLPWTSLANVDAFWVTREVLFLGSLCVLPLEGVQFYLLSKLYELYLPKKMLYRCSHPLCRGDWEMGTAIAISCTKCSQVAAWPYPRNCSGSFTGGILAPPWR